MDTQNSSTPNLSSVISKLGNLAKIGNNSNIQKFIDQLITDKGYPDLTEEVREQMKQDLIVRLDQFFMARIIAAFSDEDVVSFEAILRENKGEAEIQKFVVEHIPDLNTFLTNALLEYRGVYLGLISSPPGPIEENTPVEEVTTATTSEPEKTVFEGMPSPPKPAPVMPPDTSKKWMN